MFTPKTEWDVINGEEANVSGIITGYVVPLSAAAAAAAFVGYGLIGTGGPYLRIKGIDWGLYYGITTFAQGLISVIVAAFIIDALAPSFGSEKNIGKSVQLVAYSWTPGWVAGLAVILPALGILGLIGLIYGLYLLYMGLPKLKKTTVAQQTGYFVVSILVMIVVYFIIGMILSKILLSVFGLSFGLGDFKISL